MDEEFENKMKDALAGILDLTTDSPEHNAVWEQVRGVMSVLKEYNLISQLTSEVERWT